PCESRACQGAFSFTRTQSGPRLTAALLNPTGGSCAAAHWQSVSTTTEDVQVVAIILDFISVGLTHRLSALNARKRRGSTLPTPIIVADSRCHFTHLLPICLLCDLHSTANTNYWLPRQR